MTHPTDSEREDMADKLRIIPVSLATANGFVALHHRHHKPVIGHKFSVGVTNGELRGVAIVGRPVSRHLDDGMTLEVTRCCTDGTKNACSMLYAACRRAVFALGFDALGTYILASETGTSLKAAGWKLLGKRGGGKWSRSTRPRDDDHPTEPKLFFEVRK